MEERDIKIGKHLRNAREQRGYSIYEIAKFLEIDAYEYEKCELDEIRTKPGYVFRLSNYYECSIDHLIKGKPIEPITSSALKEIKKELKKIIEKNGVRLFESDKDSTDFHFLDGFGEGIELAYELIQDYK